MHYGYLSEKGQNEAVSTIYHHLSIFGAESFSRYLPKSPGHNYYQRFSPEHSKCAGHVISLEPGPHP